MPWLFVAPLYAGLRGLAWLILRAVCNLTVRGRQHIPRRRGVIFAATHTSYLDPVAIAAACPRHLVFLARRDLFQIGWLGGFMRLLGTIPVGRSPSDASLRRAVAQLRAGHSVVIFPEGGRQEPGVIGPAKPGVGWLAAMSGAPIVPVAVTGTDQALPYRARMLRRRKITVAFGPQIRYADTSVFQDIYQQLAEQVTAAWHRLLQP